MSEDDVKKAMIPFLREFYRYRYEPRHGSEVATLDNVGAGGLVADVLLTFQKDDGTPFRAACEATALGKEEEVRFKLDRVYFLWDCVAFAAAFTTILYAVFYATRVRWLISLDTAGNIGLLMGLGLIGFFTWYFTMRNWRKYRYIMAIAQFKQYFADEQWVAIAEDVFPSPHDPYWLELRRQCVYNGFGLALVKANGAVQAIVNPSRLGIFGHDRQLVDFVTGSGWYQQARRGMQVVARMRPQVPDASVAVWNRVARPMRENFLEPLRRNVFGALAAPFGRTRSQFDRFMRGQQAQKWVFILSVLLLVPMVYRVLTYDEGTVADFSMYERVNPEDQPGANYESGRGPIPRGEIGRTGGIPKQYFEPVEPAPGPVPTSPSAAYEPTEQPLQRPAARTGATPPPRPVTPAQIEEEEVPTINLSGDDEEVPPAAEPTPKPAAKPISTPTKTADKCAALRDKTGWLVQDNAYSREDVGQRRVQTLRAAGLTATLVQRSCVTKGESGYIVYLGGIQPTEAAARTAVARYAQTLRQARMADSKLLVRKLAGQ